MTYLDYSSQCQNRLQNSATLDNVIVGYGTKKYFLCFLCGCFVTGSVFTRFADSSYSVTDYISPEEGQEILSTHLLLTVEVAVKVCLAFIHLSIHLFARITGASP